MKLWRKIKKSFYRGLKRDRFQLIERGGVQYLVNYKNSIDRRLLVDGAYEPEQISYFKTLIEQHHCSRFYDIGANIGLYSLAIGRLKSIKKVIAFEPSSANVSQLYSNLLLNNLNSIVEVKQQGLSDKEDVLSF